MALRWIFRILNILSLIKEFPPLKAVNTKQATVVALLPVLYL